MAPELIGGHYDFKVDIWSLGVCTFMLLSSSMPFFGNDRASIVEKIVSGQYSFVGPRWQNVSDDAKRFVHKLLRRRPTKRPTAEGALQLRWLNQVVSSDRVVSNFEQMDTIQGTMQAFAKYPTLKKLALMVVAHKVSPYRPNTPP